MTDENPIIAVDAKLTDKINTGVSQNRDTPVVDGVRWSVRSWLNLYELLLPFGAVDKEPFLIAGFGDLSEQLERFT